MSTGVQEICECQARRETSGNLQNSQKFCNLSTVQSNNQIRGLTLLVHEKPDMPLMAPKRKSVFRKKLLRWDLGLLYKDLRPFAFREGEGMRERDQAI